MHPKPMNSKVFLVEGGENLHFVNHIVQRAELDVSFCVKDKKGLQNLFKSIALELSVPNQVAVGIILDANDDPRERWNVVLTKLRDKGIDLPECPCPTGTIVEGIEGKPRVGVWLMPNNCLEVGGELEDFVQQMIPAGDPVLPLARKYIEDIPCDARKFANPKLNKAVVHAWLAARKKPGLIGLAITNEDLEITGDSCKSFIDWIERLCR